ncbi:MAG: ParB N-terminal domain-containing protein [Acidobacteriia bacterium]|nr:ParB N-terminal domain-containing protein [Terriglobia bacterium]
MAVPRSKIDKDIPEASPCLSIVYHNIEELDIDPKNPRRHPKAQIRQIARSIEVFGFNVPILVDVRLRVVAGHGRVQAAKL